jgi:hypothetical protein
MRVIAYAMFASQCVHCRPWLKFRASSCPHTATPESTACASAGGLAPASVSQSGGKPGMSYALHHDKWLSSRFWSAPTDAAPCPAGHPARLPPHLRCRTTTITEETGKRLPSRAKFIDILQRFRQCLGISCGTSLTVSLISIEAADIDADEAAQRRKVGKVFKSEPDFAVSLVRMLDCPAPIL